MTDLFRTLRRRWLIVAIGLLLSVGCAYLATRAEPVFHARTEVVFLAPTSVRNPNELVTGSESIIITAGIVMKRLNGPDPVLQFNSQSVNPVGAPDTGRDAWIRLLDSGNQWVPNFDDQILVVDAVGATSEEAQQRVAVAVERIDQELASLQAELGSDPINDIHTRLSPDPPVVSEIGPSSTRAVGSILAIGLLATISIAVLVDIRSSGRKSGRSQAPTTSAISPRVASRL